MDNTQSLLLVAVAIVPIIQYELTYRARKESLMLDPYNDLSSGLMSRIISASRACRGVTSPWSKR